MKNIHSMQVLSNLSAGWIYFVVISVIAFLPKASMAQADAFITQWETTTNVLTIPTTGTGYNYNVSLINATTGTTLTTYTGRTGNVTFSGLTNGQPYRIAITGAFPRFFMNNNAAERTKLKGILQWGSVGWTSMAGAFAGCSQLSIYSATDVPNLSGVTSMHSMFAECSVFNGSIGGWNTSTVIDMTNLFINCKLFNQNIGAWNTSAVTNMEGMLAGAETFNQNISAWNTSSVTKMKSMFYGAKIFNQPVGAWNTSAVTDMSFMFFGDSLFNQPLSMWNTSSVTNMERMFASTNQFNQPLSSWNTSSVVNMEGMFSSSKSFNSSIGSWNMSSVTSIREMFFEAVAFNQPINSWNTGSITDMRHAFSWTQAFNQNLNNWNTSNVTNIEGIFQTATAFNGEVGSWNISKITSLNFVFSNAISFNKNVNAWNTSNVTMMWFTFYNTPNFNQPLANWNTSSVLETVSMFTGASAFNQDISGWNVSSVRNMVNMFRNALSFNQNLGSWQLRSAGVGLASLLDFCGIDCNNYSNTLVAWASRSSTPTNVYLGALSRRFGTNAATARTLLTTTKNWVIDGDTAAIGSCGSMVLASRFVSILAKRIELLQKNEVTFTVQENGTTDDYTLESSVDDGRTFEYHSSIKAANTNFQGMVRYTMNDVRSMTHNHTIQYRIKAVGRSNAYSAVVAVTATEKWKNLVWPNPVREVLYLKTDGLTQWTLSDQQGRQIFSGKGLNGQSRIDVASLARGIYWLRYQVGHKGTWKTEKVVVD